MAAQKAPDAFRTISEVAEWLGVNAHVLRFWESKFSQIKPVKRAGGRRYYRRSDMELLGGIKKLLHEDGLTIKGAQKVLREQGVKAVAALSKPVEDTFDEPVAEPMPVEAGTPDAAIAAARPEPEEPAAEPVAEPQPEAASVEKEQPADTVDLQPSLFDRIAGASELPPEVEIAPLPALPSEAAAQPTEEDAPPAQPVEAAARTATYGTDGGTDRGTDRGWGTDEDRGAERTAKAPEIAPLPGGDIALSDALARLLPGQVPAAELRPILARAKALRARMETRAAG